MRFIPSQSRRGKHSWTHRLGMCSLAIWFLVTNVGFMLITTEESHPNCPCGCQRVESSETEEKSSCCQNKPVSSVTISCCPKRSSATGCCGNAKKRAAGQQELQLTKWSPASGSCCTKKSQKRTEPASWNPLCRCGQKSGQLASLGEKLNHPPCVLSWSGHKLLPDTSTELQLYQNPSLDLSTPPPQPVTC